MVDTDWVTLAQAQLSLEVNGVWVMAKNVAEALQRFCRPVSFYNDDAHFDLSFAGSSLMLRDKGRNLLLCCRHQLTNAGREPQEIVTILEDAGAKRVGLSPDEVTQILPAEESDRAFDDATDILMAEYRAKPAGRDPSPHFLSLDLEHTPDLRAVPPGSVDVMFAIGYPSADESYEPSHDDEYNVVGADIVSRWVKLYLAQVPRTDWDARGLTPLGPAQDNVHVLDEPDGISGSPVFFLYDFRARSPKLGFAGMVVRANREGRVNMLEAAHIRAAAARMADAPPQGEGLDGS